MTDTATTGTATTDARRIPGAVRGHASFLDAIAEVASQHPHETAVLDARGETTYRALHDAARRVAGSLVARGIGRGDLVAVQLPRDWRAHAVVTGIMLAGAAYVPLDPTHPRARRRLALDRANCAALVTLAHGAEERALAGDDVLLAEDLLTGPDLDGPSRAHPDSLAYVLFTSGSTGEPKGVQITHRNLDALLAWTTTRLSADDVRATAAATSFTFDPSVLETFTTLALGGTLHVLGSALDVSGSADLTFLFSTPSVVGELARAGRLPVDLRILMTGGEALPRSVLDAVLTACPDVTVLHQYGPTEATVWVTCQELRRGDGQEIHLGQPLPGCGLWIVDGELCLSGDQVSPGYVGRDDLTAERFVTWTTPDGGTIRVYRTGDRVERAADGTLRFLGRTDRQVKVRGHRIELDEVQDALVAHPAVAEAGVVVAGEGPLAHLVAYVVLNQGSEATPDDDLLSGVRSRLASYMVPGVLVRLTEVPRTVTGKLDLKELTARAAARVPVTQAVTAGATPVDDSPVGRVADTVREVLGLTSTPAATDDFLLDLGGTSLALLRLVTVLEASTGARIGLDGVLTDTTVAGIAAHLGRPAADDGRTAGTSWLQRDGSRPPLVLFHLYVGGMLKYRALRGLLPDRPVLLIDPTSGTEAQGMSLTELADRAVDLLRRERPHGPYLLGGHSAGGLLAVEVARTLREAGEQVVELVVIDSPAARGAVGYYWGEVVMHAPEFARGSWTERGDKLAAILAKRSVLFRRVASRGSVTQVYSREAASNAAVLRSRSRGYDGPVTVLRTRQGRAMALGRDDLGWGGLLTGRVRVREVPGTHNGIFDAENVGELAAAVDAALPTAGGQR